MAPIVTVNKMVESTVDEDHAVTVNGVEHLTPPNYSVVVEGELAACGLPSLPGHLTFLREQRVQVLVSLTLETDLLPQAHKGRKRR